MIAVDRQCQTEISKDKSRVWNSLVAIDHLNKILMVGTIHHWESVYTAWTHSRTWLLKTTICWILTILKTCLTFSEWEWQANLTVIMDLKTKMMHLQMEVDMVLLQWIRMRTKGISLRNSFIVLPRSQTNRGPKVSRRASCIDRRTSRRLWILAHSRAWACSKSVPVAWLGEGPTVEALSSSQRSFGALLSHVGKYSMIGLVWRSITPSMETNYSNVHTTAAASVF